MVKGDLVFETPWFAIEAVPAQPNGENNGPYYRLCQEDGVIVMVLSVDGDVVLVRQYRPALDMTTIEVPAGSIDGKESPEEAAKREVYEETGYICENLTYLGCGRMMMNRVTSREHMYLATAARKDREFKNAENFETLLLNPEIFRGMIASGEFEQMSALSILFKVEEKFGKSLFDLAD